MQWLEMYIATFQLLNSVSDHQTMLADYMSAYVTQIMFIYNFLHIW